MCSIFYWRVDQILEEVDEAVSVANNITDYAHTEKEHDPCLHPLMQTACKYILSSMQTNVTQKLRVSCSLDVSMIAVEYAPDPAKVYGHC